MEGLNSSNKSFREWSKDTGHQAPPAPAEAGWEGKLTKEQRVVRDKTGPFDSLVVTAVRRAMEVAREFRAQDDDSI